MLESDELKIKRNSKAGPKPKSPFYFNPKSENRKLSQLIEAIVMCELERSNNPRSFKIVGYQLKNEEKIKIENIKQKDSVSDSVNRYSKCILLQKSPFLCKWNQITHNYNDMQSR